MLFDICYKLLRKSIGDRLYRFISWSPLGRSRRNQSRMMFERIFRHYREHGLNCAGKIVAELGCGDQFHTAAFFLENGARRVLLIEPKIRAMPADEVRRRLIETGSQTVYEPDRLQIFGDLSEVPASYDGGVDWLGFYTVLEHLPELDAYYRHAGRLLSASGTAHNAVDLTDHTYHVFTSFRLTRAFAHSRALYHLRYSARLYAFLTDNRTYVNRRLLPAHLSLAQKHGLDVVALEKHPYRPVPVHADVLSGCAGCDPSDLHIAGFNVTLRRSG